MKEIIYSGLLTVGFTLVYQLVLRRIYSRLNLYVSIDTRSSHTTQVTATGGIALFLAVFSTTLFYYFTASTQPFDYSILLPLSILFLTGVIDDLQDTSYKIKLLLQIIAAKLVVDQGLVLDEIYLTNGLVSLNYFMAQILTGFLFISIVNAINFIDGLDGLAISFSLFFTGVITILSQDNPLFYFNLILLFGLVVGLIFNFQNHGKVFLGDSGSLFLGGSIALNILQLLEPSVGLNFNLDPNKFLLAGLLIFYPLIDITRTVFGRLLQKKSPFAPDRSHLHHLLLDKTRSHAKSVALLIGGCFLFLIVGLGLWHLLDEWGIIIWLLVGGLPLLLGIRPKKS